jgi:hypothetical protein
MSQAPRKYLYSPLFFHCCAQIDDDAAAAAAAAAGHFFFSLPPTKSVDFSATSLADVVIPKFNSSFIHVCPWNKVNGHYSEAESIFFCDV